MGVNKGCSGKIRELEQQGLCGVKGAGRVQNRGQNRIRLRILVKAYNLLYWALETVDVRTVVNLCGSSTG